MELNAPSKKNPNDSFYTVMGWVEWQRSIPTGRTRESMSSDSDRNVAFPPLSLQHRAGKNNLWCTDESTAELTSREHNCFSLRHQLILLLCLEIMAQGLETNVSICHSSWHYCSDRSLIVFHMEELIRHLQEKHMEENTGSTGRKCCIIVYF